MCMRMPMMMIMRRHVMLSSLTQAVIAALRWSEVHFWLDHWVLWLPDWFVDSGKAFVVVEAFALGVGTVFIADDAAGFLMRGVVWLDIGVLELSFKSWRDHLD